MKFIFGAPRRSYWLICIACVLMLLFGMYLQHVVGLEPCPMCVVQRYAIILIAVCAALAGATGRNVLQKTWGLLGLVFAVGGAYTAARQTWLQWHPPEFASCGRDIYGMIETFPLQRAIPMIFKGSGDCSKVDWAFLGLSIANWSFICFTVFGLLLLGLIIGRGNRPAKRFVTA